MRNFILTSVVIGAWSLNPALSSAQRAPDDELFFVGKPLRVDEQRSVEAAVVIGDDLVIAGTVDGLAATVGGDLHVLPGARVDGAVAAIGGELRIDPGAQVEGPRIVVEGGDFRQVADSLSSMNTAPSAPPAWLGSAVRVAQMLALFVIGIFLVALAPRQVQNVRETLARRLRTAGLVGFGALLGVIPLCVLLAVSLLGIPLIPLVIVAALAVCAFGAVAIAVAIGQALPLLKDRDNLFGAMALGMIVLALGVAVPALGGLVLFVTSALGAGAVLISRFGTRPPAPLPPATAIGEHHGAEGVRSPA